MCQLMRQAIWQLWCWTARVFEPNSGQTDTMASFTCHLQSNKLSPLATCVTECKGKGRFMNAGVSCLLAWWKLYFCPAETCLSDSYVSGLTDTLCLLDASHSSDLAWILLSVSPVMIHSQSMLITFKATVLYPKVLFSPSLFIFLKEIVIVLMNLLRLTSVF